MKRFVIVILLWCVFGCDQSVVDGELDGNTSGVPGDSSITRPPIGPDSTSLEARIDSVHFFENIPDVGVKTVQIDSVGTISARVFAYDIPGSVRRTWLDSTLTHFRPEFLTWMPTTLTYSNCDEHRYHLKLFESDSLIVERHALVCRDVANYQSQVLTVLAGFDSLSAIRDRVTTSYFERGCHLFNGDNC